MNNDINFDFRFTSSFYKDWSATKDTFHLFLQILGKVKLATNPRRNHWWHIPFYLQPRGLSSNSIPHTNQLFEIRIDLVDHKVNFVTTTGEASIPLQDGLSVAAFYQQVMEALDGLGLPTKILARPFDNISKIPFAEDHTHKTYNPEHIRNYFNNLWQVSVMLQLWQRRFKGKGSPVHAFWHSFDIATTFFSGKPGPSTEGWDPVSAEAYSDEVMSFGWWPGDHKFEEAAFYCYMYPDPDNSLSMPLAPEQAFWTESNGSGLAILKHEDVVQSSDPAGMVLEFFNNFFDKGCELMDFQLENMRYPVL